MTQKLDSAEHCGPFVLIFKQGNWLRVYNPVPLTSHIYRLSILAFPGTKYLTLSL